METYKSAQMGFAQTIIPDKIKYCLYARKSTESDEQQALSIDSQINEMMAIAEREGLDIIDVRRESHSANFCAFALHHFNTGTLQQKREIFSTISSNITLRDKKISISKLSPYLIIENGLLDQQRLNSSLEPKTYLLSKGQKRFSDAQITSWLPR